MVNYNLAAFGSIEAGRCRDELWYNARMLKVLRIAATALSLTACMLLIALWVRSYSSAGGGWHKLTRIGTDQFVFYESADGEVRLLSVDAFMASSLSVWQPGFAVPYWSLVSGFVLLAAMPWMRRSFSLRTLLIATTLVAVWLGIVIVAQ